MHSARGRWASLALSALMSSGIPCDKLRGPHQRVPLRKDRLAGLRRPWGARLRGGQDGWAHGGQRAQTQRRRHRGHSSGRGAHEVCLPGTVSVPCMNTWVSDATCSRDVAEML